jgi:hypothetical protein
MTMLERMRNTSSWESHLQIRSTKAYQSPAAPSFAGQWLIRAQGASPTAKLPAHGFTLVCRPGACASSFLSCAGSVLKARLLAWALAQGLSLSFP